MARDVEFNVTASDKTGAALASVERGFKRTHDRIAKQQDDIGGSRLIQAVARSSPQLAAKLTSVFSQVADAAPVLLGAGVAAAAPLIGATLSAAVIGGAGVGGVVGGALLAARDPRVKAAGAQLGQNLLGQLTADAAPFVEPMLRNIAKVEARFGQMNGRVKNIFKNSSGFLDPLVDGALDGIDGILRGVDRLVARAKPVMVSFGGAFARIGDATGDAMETISGGAEDAAGAIDDLSRVVAVAIEFTGGLVRALTGLYGVMKFVSPLGEAALKGLSKLVGAEDGAKRSAEDAKPPTTDLSGAFKDLGGNASAAAHPIHDLDKEMSDAATAARNLYGATTDVAGAAANASGAIKENGRTVAVNTTKGRANRQALLDLAQAMVRQHDGYVAVNGEGVKSAGISETNRAAFIAMATKAGYSATKAKELATQLGLIPTRHETDIIAQTAAAEARVKHVKELLNGLHNKTVTVTAVINDARLNKLDQQLRAHGGIYAAGTSWAATAGDGMSRTGGPMPVNVNSTVESRLYLDGSLVYAGTARQVNARAERDAWRQKVGAR